MAEKMEKASDVDLATPVAAAQKDEQQSSERTRLGLQSKLLVGNAHRLEGPDGTESAPVNCFAPLDHPLRNNGSTVPPSRAPILEPDLAYQVPHAAKRACGGDILGQGAGVETAPDTAQLLAQQPHTTVPPERVGVVQLPVTVGFVYLLLLVGVPAPAIPIGGKR